MSGETTLGPLAKAEGKKRAEQVVPATDPQFLPWFQLGFIDGAFWGFALAMEQATK